MKNKLAENIKRFRKARNLTQEQLAEALGVTVGAVYKWESSRSSPEVSLLMELATVFGVSVDALLGYELQSDSVSDIVARLKELLRNKDYEKASPLAESALLKYPNDFRIVYRCAVMYNRKGMENADAVAVQRAVSLFHRSLLLLSQNTDPDISEAYIRQEIALSHISLNQKEEALSLLKDNNICGINNALIGLTCSGMDEASVEKAFPYLSDSFSDCLQKLVQTMCGYINVYFRTQKYDLAAESVSWLIHYLDSVKNPEYAVSYTDKIVTMLYAQQAFLSAKTGHFKEAEEFLRKAAKIARCFDEAPCYQLRSIKFCIRDSEDPSLYDDIGSTAHDAVTQCLQGDDALPELLELWEKIKHENT